MANTTPSQCQGKPTTKLDQNLQTKSPKMTVNGAICVPALVFTCLCKRFLFRPTRFTLNIDNLNGNVQKKRYW